MFRKYWKWDKAQIVTFLVMFQNTITGSCNFQGRAKTKSNSHQRSLWGTWLLIDFPRIKAKQLNSPFLYEWASWRRSALGEGLPSSFRKILFIAFLLGNRLPISAETITISLSKIIVKSN